MATICPAGTLKEIPRRIVRGCTSSYAKLTSRNSICEENGGSGVAFGDSATSVWVSIISKMRSAAAIVCCRFALTRLNFFAGAYIRNSAATNDVNSPVVSLPLAIWPLPYQIANARPMPPSSSMDGGRTDSALTTLMFVRYRCMSVARKRAVSSSSAPNAFTILWAENVS